MIRRKRMYEAFIQGDLGTDESYFSWTPVWAVRSKIWRKGALKKQAIRSLGEMVYTAVEEGNPETLRQFASTLEEKLPARSVVAIKARMKRLGYGQLFAALIHASAAL